MELFHSMRNIMGASTMSGAVFQIHLAKLSPLHTALQDAPDERAAGRDHLLLVELGNFGKFCASLNINGDARRLGGANALPPPGSSGSAFAGVAHERFQCVVPFSKAPTMFLAHHDA